MSIKKPAPAPSPPQKLNFINLKKEMKLHCLAGSLSGPWGEWGAAVTQGKLLTRVDVASERANEWEAELATVWHYHFWGWESVLDSQTSVIQIKGQKKRGETLYVRQCSGKAKPEESGSSVRGMQWPLNKTTAVKSGPKQQATSTVHWNTLVYCSLSKACQPFCCRAMAAPYFGNRVELTVEHKQQQKHIWEESGFRTYCLSLSFSFKTVYLHTP